MMFSPSIYTIHGNQPPRYQDPSYFQQFLSGQQALNSQYSQMYRLPHLQYPLSQIDSYSLFNNFSSNPRYHSNVMQSFPHISPSLYYSTVMRSYLARPPNIDYRDSYSRLSSIKDRKLNHKKKTSSSQEIYNICSDPTSVDNDDKLKTKCLISNPSSNSIGALDFKPNHSFDHNIWFPRHFMRGSVIELANKNLKRVEDLQTEDFFSGEDVNPNLYVSCSRVTHIDKNYTEWSAIVDFCVDGNKDAVKLKVSFGHPFFVFGQGWSSCNPKHSFNIYGLRCHQLKVSDRCITLRHKHEKRHIEKLPLNREIHSATTSYCKNTLSHYRSYPMRTVRSQSEDLAYNDDTTLKLRHKSDSDVPLSRDHKVNKCKKLLKRSWSAPRPNKNY